MAIKIAANQVAPTDFYFDYGHLQLVNTSSNTEIEVQQRWADAKFNWVVNIDTDHDDTWFSPGSSNEDYPFDPLRYSSITIHLRDGQSDADVWRLAQEFALRLDDFNFLYGGLTQNSNSFVNTLMYMVGWNLRDYEGVLKTSEMSNFPGSGRNVLLDSGTDVSITTSGTSSADYIRLGRGDDVVNASEGADRVYTASGDDVLNGVLTSTGNVYDLGDGGWFRRDHDVADYAGQDVTVAFGVQSCDLDR